MRVGLTSAVSDRTHNRTRTHADERIIVANAPICRFFLPVFVTALNARASSYRTQPLRSAPVLHFHTRSHGYKTRASFNVYEQLHTCTIACSRANICCAVTFRDSTRAPLARTSGRRYPTRVNCLTLGALLGNPNNNKAIRGKHVPRLVAFLWFIYTYQTRTTLYPSSSTHSSCSFSQYITSNHCQHVN